MRPEPFPTDHTSPYSGLRVVAWFAVLVLAMAVLLLPAALLPLVISHKAQPLQPPQPSCPNVNP